MSCAYHINNNEGLVTIYGNDRVAAAEIVNTLKALFGDPNFDPNLPQLVDLRGLNHFETELDQHQTQNFLHDHYRARISSSVAVVVDDQLEPDLISALYLWSCNLEKTEIFDQYNQALKWLMRREFAE